jgi:thioredoxin-related protein
LKARLSKIFTKNRLGTAALLLWVPLVVYPITMFTASHILTLPVPKDQFKLRDAMRGLNPDSEGWTAIHTLMSGCNCSSDVGKHLLQRGRVSELASETVLLIDAKDEEAKDFEAKGFQTKRLKSQELVEVFGLEAAPSMVILNPDREVAYLGGYYARSARTEALDLKVIADLKRDGYAKALPLFGCAVGERLQTALDPSKLKYREEGEKVKNEP